MIIETFWRHRLARAAAAATGGKLAVGGKTWDVERRMGGEREREKVEQSRVE